MFNAIINYAYNRVSEGMNPQFERERAERKRKELRRRIDMKPSMCRRAYTRLGACCPGMRSMRAADDKGKGFAGVITSWGCTNSSRKMRRGLRKITCIGTWPPVRVKFHLPRSGPNGIHIRTDINGTICFVSKAVNADPYGIMSKADLTEKNSFL